jgi:hypothetical protein
MPLVTHFCGVCGCRVPPSDLEDGRAVILNHVTYCGECAAKAGIEAEAPSAPPAPSLFEAPARRRPTRPASRSEAARRPAAGPARRATAARTSARAAARTPGRPPSGVLVGALLAGCGVLVVLGALALLVIGGSDEPTPGPTEARSTLPEPAGPTRPVHEEPRVDPTREALLTRAHAVFETVEELAPALDAGIPELRSAVTRVEERVEELDALSRRASGDPRLAVLARRAEAVGRRLEERIGEQAAKLCRRRMEAVEAFLATKNFDRALRALRDVPEGLEGTTWADRLGREVARVERARDEHLRAEVHRKDAGWTYLYTAASFDGWNRRGSASWELSTDPLGYRYLSISNSGAGQATVSFAAPGSEQWKDYKLRVDLRDVEGDLVVYVRGPGGATGATGIRVQAAQLPKTSDWWTLQIDVQGDVVRLFLGSRLVKQIRNPAGIAGGLGFGLESRGRMEIRNVRAKLVP